MLLWTIWSTLKLKHKPPELFSRRRTSPSCSACLRLGSTPKPARGVSRMFGSGATGGFVVSRSRNGLSVSNGALCTLLQHPFQATTQRSDSRCRGPIHLARAQLRTEANAREALGGALRVGRQGRALCSYAPTRQGARPGTGRSGWAPVRSRGGWVGSASPAPRMG